jgi:hypothetical protein
MKTLSVLLLGLVTSVAAAADKTTSCVDTAPCPAGQKPPACCKPPPCMVFRQIQMKMVLQYLFNSKIQRALAMKAGGGDTAAAYNKLNDQVMTKAKDGTIGKYIPACAGDPTPDPPSFSTNSECQRTDADGPISEDQANQKYATCKEFISGSFRHEDLHKERCSHQSSTDRAKAPMSVSADEEVSGYEKEIAALRGDLQKHWMACSPVIDAAERIQLIKAGVKIAGGRR